MPINRYQLRESRRRIETDPHVVTFGVRKKGADGDTFDGYTLTPAYRSMVTIEDLAKYGIVGTNVLPNRYRWWRVWREVMEQSKALNGASKPMPEPKTTDTVTDDEGVTWVVKVIENTMQGECYRCLCWRER